MATAALAALPPPMEMNSLACTLVSGIGNALTRKISSRTAMPAQRMLAMSEKALVGLCHLLGVMAGLVPAICVFLTEGGQIIRGCPRRRGPRRVTRRGVIARA